MHRAVRRQHHVFAHHVANDCANRLHHSSNPSQPLDALDPEDAQMLQVAPAFMQHAPYQMLQATLAASCPCAGGRDTAVVTSLLSLSASAQKDARTGMDGLAHHRQAHAHTSDER